MINIISEPSNQTYLSLLHLAQKYCSSFSLVWRDQLKFDKSANECETALKPFLVLEEESDEWPGTKLSGSKAKVRRYQLTNESLSILYEAKSLYAWLAPNLPEDVVFYTSEGVWWLSSISHEKDSVINSDLISLPELRAAVPELDFYETAVL